MEIERFAIRKLQPIGHSTLHRFGPDAA